MLIVDDEEMVRRVFCDLLQKKGFHVADAETGPLALALFPLFRPDVVLLDILMPGMDGIEVLKQMKQWNPDVCVIMLTGVKDMTIARNAIQQGADDYLTKPFKYEQLETILAVRGVLGSSALNRGVKISAYFPCFPGVVPVVLAPDKWAEES